MIPGQDITVWVIVVTAALLGVYDIWVAWRYGTAATISWVTLTRSLRWPFFPFAAGVLCGHLFVGQNGYYYPPSEYEWVLDRSEEASKFQQMGDAWVVAEAQRLKGDR